MLKKDVVGLILAGGQGSRLGILTKTIAKPAVLFGGKYRIIDFTLSNCVNSGIDTVGVLTQYQPLKLNSHIGIGKPWDMDRVHGGVTILSPYMKAETGEWYKGTANAVFQNIHYLESLAPKYVVILSGDHIYKMDYSQMVDFHEKNNADATISVIDVPLHEASRYGIMNANPDGKIFEFDEKPKKPKSTLASMGVYVFNWNALREYLLKDNENPNSHNDFGKNIIPMMLQAGKSLYAYRFEGYWKDVGTIQALWESNMDLVSRVPDFNLFDDWKIYTPNASMPANYIAEGGSVKHALVAEGCVIYGTVKNSVIFPGVHIGEGALVEDSIVMSGSTIGKDSRVIQCIVSEKATIEEDVWVGIGEKEENENFPHIYDSGITVLGEESLIPQGSRIGKNVMVDNMARAEDFASKQVDSGKCIFKGGSAQ